jgi:hypothetical protein
LISDLGAYEGTANLGEIDSNKEINPIKCMILSISGRKI